MGGSCCADRSKPSSPAAPSSKPPADAPRAAPPPGTGGAAGAAGAASAGRRPKSSATAEGKRRVLSIGPGGTGDAAKFDAAILDLQSDAPGFSQERYASAMEVFVSLIPSRQRIDFSERIHEWAAAPVTVGALTCLHLATVSQCEDEGASKRLIGSLGAVPKLVESLSSDEAGRVDGAAIALGCLLEDSEDACRSARQAGALPVLVGLLGRPCAGLRICAAWALRCMWLSDAGCRHELVELDGLRLAVSQLSFESEGSVEQVSFLTDSCCVLLDLIEEPDPEKGGEGIVVVNAEHGRACVEHGAIEQLQRIRGGGFDDAELQSCVDELLECLLPFEHQGEA